MSVDEVGRWNREKAGEFSERNIYGVNQSAPEGTGIEAEAAIDDLFSAEMASKSLKKRVDSYENMWKSYNRLIDSLKPGEPNFYANPDDGILTVKGQKALRDIQEDVRKDGRTIVKKEGRQPTRKEREELNKNLEKSNRRLKANLKKARGYNLGGIIGGPRPVKRRRSIIG